MRDIDLEGFVDACWRDERYENRGICRSTVAPLRGKPECGPELCHFWSLVILNILGNYWKAGRLPLACTCRPKRSGGGLVGSDDERRVPIACISLQCQKWYVKDDAQPTLERLHREARLSRWRHYRGPHGECLILGKK